MELLNEQTDNEDITENNYIKENNNVPALYTVILLGCNGPGTVSTGLSEAQNWTFR
jgi:hypothetical protein